MREPEGEKWGSGEEEGKCCITLWGESKVKKKKKKKVSKLSLRVIKLINELRRSVVAVL